MNLRLQLSLVWSYQIRMLHKSQMKNPICIGDFSSYSDGDFRAHYVAHSSFQEVGTDWSQNVKFHNFDFILSLQNGGFWFAVIGKFVVYVYPHQNVSLIFLGLLERTKCINKNTSFQPRYCSRSIYKVYGTNHSIHSRGLTIFL